MSKKFRMPLITLLDAPEVADTEGVRRFAEAMNLKMAKKRDQGKRGWNSPVPKGNKFYFGCTVKNLEASLREHCSKGDVVDIANLCMMIWNRRNPRGLE